MYDVGDRVRYKGRETSFLIGAYGVVTDEKGQHSFPLSMWDSVPVRWDDIGYYGVYQHNVEKVSKIPSWEV